MKTLKHYVGHRERLRKRFMDNPTSISDYEIFEMLLFYIHKRRDVKQIAKEIKKEIGNWRNILNIDFKEKNYEHIMNMLKDIIIKVKQNNIEKVACIASREEILNYCSSISAPYKIRMLWLNQRSELIGETSSNDFCYSIIISEAIYYNATRLVIVTQTFIDSDAMEELSSLLLDVGVVIHDSLYRP